MKIEYDTINIPKSGKESWKRAKLEYRGVYPEEFCCGRMAGAYGEVVKFGSFSDHKRDNNDINMPLLWWACGDANYDDYQIDYCPFCGEAIEVVERGKYNRVYHKRTETIEKEYFEDIVV